MGFHTFDADGADRLEDPDRYRFLSVEEILALFDPGPDDRVVDLGSGTGFYTDEVAAVAGTVYAVDLQAPMHRHYRDKGVPENVHPITATVTHLPLATDSLQGAFSTMTYHEFASPDALAELYRALAPGARLGLGDWSAAGIGENGPPLDERYDASDARDHLEAAGFEVLHCADRRETFVASARVPP